MNERAELPTHPSVCALLHLRGWLPRLLSLSLLKIAAFSEIPLHTTSSINLLMAGGVCANVMPWLPPGTALLP